MSNKRNPQDWQLLSAYMDGALPPRQRASLEARLDAEPDLMHDLLQLQQTRRILRSIPHKRAPRSFALTPAMVAKSRRMPLFAVLRLSSITTAALSALLAIFGLLPQLARMPAATAPVSYEAAVPDTGPMMANTEAPAEAAPPLIQWGQSPDAWGSAGGMGGGGDGNVAVDTMPNDTAILAEPQPTVVAQSQPSDPRLMPTPTPAINVLVPPPAQTPEPVIEAPVMGTAMPESTARPTESLKELVDENTQPILGIAPTEERGQVTAPAQLPTMETPTGDYTNTEGQPQFRLWLVWATVLSGALSLVFALIAWWIRRR